MSDSGMPAVPYALAMLVCDGVHRDPMTGKVYVLGSFFSIFAREFPTTQSICIYALLTDGYGKVPVTLRIVDVDAAEEPLFEAEAEVEFSDPRVMAELVFGPERISLPAEGEYRFQLFAGPELVIERRIVLRAFREDAEND